MRGRRGTPRRAPPARKARRGARGGLRGPRGEVRPGLRPLRYPSKLVATPAKFCGCHQHRFPLTTCLFETYFLNFLQNFSNKLIFFLTFLRSETFTICTFCRSRRDVPNSAWIAKFGVDTTENGPSGVCCENAALIGGT